MEKTIAVLGGDRRMALLARLLAAVDFAAERLCALDPGLVVEVRGIAEEGEPGVILLDEGRADPPCGGWFRRASYPRLIA